MARRLVQFLYDETGNEFFEVVDMTPEEEGGLGRLLESLSDRGVIRHVSIGPEQETPTPYEEFIAELLEDQVLDVGPDDVFKLREGT